MRTKSPGLLYLILCLSSGALAQNITKSPYSIFGFGEKVYAGNATTWSMGQTTQGIRNPYFVNFQNPASYSATFTTNIEAGLVAGNNTVKSATATSESSNAWMGYFNFGVPVSSKRGIGISFGTTPYSGVGYQMSAPVKIPQDSIGKEIDATYNFYGRGGLSRLYFGYGMRLHRNVSAGVNAHYLFGETRHTTQLLIPASHNMFNTNEDRTKFISGWVYDLGVQVHDTITMIRGNKMAQYEWVAGFTFSPVANLDLEQGYLLRSLPIGGSSGIKDTVYQESGMVGSAVMPMSWRAGFSFAKKENWMVSSDLWSTQWSQFKMPGNTDSLRNSFGFGMGASWIPNAKAKSYFSRIEYRLGGRYEQTPLEVNGYRINAMALTAGMGLPIAKNRSRVNLGVEWMQRGTTTNGLLKEEFVRVFIGISFADRWFYRYRYD